MSTRERRSSDRHRSPAGLRKEERRIRVRALKHAAPYLKRFGGKTFVIKTGGAAVAAEEAVKGLVEQVALLFELGIRVVLVHGGGPQSTELARKLGVRSRFVGGRRVTDSEALRVTTMVLNGEINTRILAACRDFELPAIGLSGVDAGLIRAHRRPPVKVGEGAAEETVDYGYVGDIDRVDSGLLERLLGIGALPVVSPISADEAGTLLNINADTVASALSVALGAEKLILLGEAPGLLADPEDPGSVVSFLDLAGLEEMRASGPSAPACSRRPCASERLSKAAWPGPTCCPPEHPTACCWRSSPPRAAEPW